MFEGSAIDDGERITRRVVTIVTDLTKEINGVNSVVVWERDYNEGQLVEAELGFFAQDNDGNVWHMGEYPEEYEDGEFDKAPGWLAGPKGATAGIAMRAEPRLETPGYAQGYAPPPINWIDRGRVYKVGQKTCVPVDCYEDVLVIEEFERNMPGAYQLKYYAPGVGDVRVGWRGPEEEEKEGLGLVKDVRLSPEALAEDPSGRAQNGGSRLRAQGLLQGDAASEAHALKDVGPHLSGVLMALPGQRPRGRRWRLSSGKVVKAHESRSRY